MVIRVKKILSSYLKPNAEWSVFVVEILRSKSETIMSKCQKENMSLWHSV